MVVPETPCATCNGEPNECEDCFACGASGHVFRDEPYCEFCGKPHEGYFDAIKELIGIGGKRR